MAPRKNNEPASWEVDADKPKPDGESRARRSYAVKDLTERPAAGIDTVYDVVEYAARTHGSKNAFGTREVERMISEEKEITKMVNGKEETVKKKWQYYKLTPLKWSSSEAFLQRVRDVGSGLRTYGIGGGEDKSFFNIYASTGLNWLTMAQVAAFNGVPICTAYDSLGPDALVHALNETEVKGMFASGELLGTLVNILGKCPTIRVIVYDDKLHEHLLDKIRTVRDDIQLVHIDELEKIGKEKPLEPSPAKREEVFCCMYTSGSTGTPKGVLLTHRNITAAIASVWTILYEVLEPTDVYLAFLPLAHILEFVVELSFLFAGVPIAYGKVKTLTDASVRECKSDIMEVRPSIMVGVPQVWELIRKGITTKVEAGSSLKKSIFNLAFKAKANGIPVLAGLADSVVFNQVRAQTGGRLKIIFNGGGPVAKSTQHFLSTALVMMIQGYGLTEGTAMATILNPAWMQYSSVGGPVPGAEIKLVDAPEAGYLSSNDPPRGEVYIRGPSLFQGYYKRPDLDAEAITPDGWFRSGDIGQWNEDGTLSIIDRIKNLIKLQGGEYIAIEHLEAIYKSVPIVANGVVVANQQHTHPAMIVTVHPVNFPAWVQRNGLSTTGDVEHLCKEPNVVNAVVKELNAAGQKQGLRGMELLEAAVLTPDEWTPQNGFLTAAQKLQRRHIEKHYYDQVNAVYALDQ